MRESNKMEEDGDAAIFASASAAAVAAATSSSYVDPSTGLSARGPNSRPSSASRVPSVSPANATAAPRLPLPLDCFSARLMYSASLSPITSRAGVRAMLNTTTMIRSLFRSSGSTFSMDASLSSTKASSPPWLNRSPVFTLSARLSPKKGAAKLTMLLLTAIRPNSSVNTIGHSVKSSSRSIVVPVVTKNMPRSRPLNGLMSASTCAR
mmetsp:Transcript_1463/g.3254  ORF Transcript_1463/g.3254 Transcript_1463/m.3254 type:complete len:208 (+) Transcript_1463:603-1226(+)